MSTVIKELSANRSFGGWVRRYSHQSSSTNTEMKFHVDENFIQKGCALAWAAKHGIILVSPDTSPRGAGVEGETDSWDFGVGAGFYVDATEPKWAKNYRMYTYVTSELPSVISANFNVSADRQSIFGHSMGGHGALICSLKNPGKYKSVSAFAPIAHPVEAPWGKKALAGYLGGDVSAWKAYDATELVKGYAGPKIDILIDQGEGDRFLKDQLTPDAFADAARENKNVTVTLRLQPEYNHSYFFVSTFMEDHLAHHAKYLL